jgi:hypothetical protein
MTDAVFGQRPATKAVKAFQCPACGGPISLRAVGISVTAVCRQCSSVVDTANPDLKVIQASRENAYSTAIEIGSRGELYGTTWEVIGYTRKSVKGTIYGWDEYLLFNPWQGFRFLSQSNGHWTFFKRLNGAIVGIGRRNCLSYNGKNFSVFNKDYVVVESVQGEFYWRVKKGDESYATDYVRSPYMLSCEEVADEMNISLGIYVERSDLKRAFPDANLPHPSGVGACQPPPYRNRAGKILKLGLAAAGLAIALHIGMATMLPSRVIAEVSGHPIQVKPPSVSPPASGAMWNLPSETPLAQTEGQTLVTQSFELPRSGNIRLEIRTGLDNGWADFDLTLVNDTTNVSYPMQNSVSYYHGYEDGENWREGSNAATAWLSSIPKGRYHLLIDAETDQFGKTNQLPFDLVIRNGVSEQSNLWIALLLIAIYPGIVLFRRWSFESLRWSNSDYTPADSVDGVDG